MTVISDSTTVITLLNIDRMDVLSNLFDRVILPQRVYDEITIAENITLDTSYFVTRNIGDRELYTLLTKSLDAGEAEAIVLALEKELPLIMDEKKGRKVAHRLGIKLFGFIGLLILNYRKGLMSSSEVIDLFYEAKDQGFRVGEQLEKGFFDLLRQER